jgi:hypothetical protein
MASIREKMKIPANVVDQLILGSQSDIRQVLNMLSTWRLSSSSMDFDEAKNLYVLFLVRRSLSSSVLPAQKSTKSTPS